MSRPERRSPTARWWPLLLVVAVAVVAVAVVQHPKTPLAAPSPPSPTPTTTSTSPTPTPGSSGPVSSTRSSQSPTIRTTESYVPFGDQTPGPPSTSRTGHSIAGVTAEWELFGLSTEGLVRIQLAKGIITRTPVPPSGSSGPVSLVIGPDRAVIRPLDYVAGYQVVDGNAATDLPPDLGVAGPALPGPDPAHFWAQTSRDGEALALVSWKGVPTGTTVIAPPTGNLVGALPDGAGGVLFEAESGVYRSTGGTAVLLTSGNLLAAGGGRALVSECARVNMCSTVLIDAKGVRRAVPVPAGNSVGSPTGIVASKYAGSGLLSPDGTLAVLTISGTAGGLTVFNLVTGSRKLLSLDVNPAEGLDAVVFTPDGRSLFVDHNGTLNIVNLATGKVTPIEVALPPLAKLTIRP